jgi:hypothetical protein
VTRRARPIDGTGVQWWPARRAPGWLLGLALLGCGTSEPPPPPCPLALIVQGAEQIATYRSAVPPDPAELRYLAVLADLSSGCRYQDGGLELALAFNLIAERGAAMADETLRLAYFVGAVAPDGRLLDKQRFTAELTWPVGRERTGVQQELVLRYPSIDIATGPDYRFYLGFQLDPAEQRESIQQMAP